MYESTAEFYDNCMKKDYDYTGWAKFILSLIDPSHTKGIDMGCGTGRMTYRFVQAGKDVVGVDPSTEMLFAAQNAKFRGRRPEFLLGDARTFKPLKKVQFVVASCDVVNYLSLPEVSGFFMKARSYLEEGGELIFDITSKRRLEEMERERVYFTDCTEYTRLWEVTGDDEKTRVELIYFIPGKDGRYIRRDEKHILYKHSFEGIAEVLDKAGYDWEAYEDFGGTPYSGGDRIYYKAKRK